MKRWEIVVGTIGGCYFGYKFWGTTFVVSMFAIVFLLFLVFLAKGLSKTIGDGFNVLDHKAREIEKEKKDD